MTFNTTFEHFKTELSLILDITSGRKREEAGWGGAGGGGGGGGGEGVSMKGGALWFTW